jgi:hypothetical protein
VKGAREVDVERAPPHLGVEPIEPVVGTDELHRRIRHDDIEPAQHAGGVHHRGGDRLLVCDVGDERERPAALVLHRGLRGAERVLVDVEQHDARTLPGEAQRHRTADPVGGASDERAAPAQTEVFARKSHPRLLSG